MSEGILSLIGKTPILKLSHFMKDAPFDIYAKLEGFNPGGSIKDRPAFEILKHAMQAGEVMPGTVVIESSSGNMGIGLAQACSYYGLRFICVIDPKTTLQNTRILKAYGAEIDLVSEPDPVTGEFLQARINRVHFLLDSIPNSFWPNQYSNIHNSMAHRQTMREIISTLGKVDYLFCSTSTCGTLRGCAEYVRENNAPTKVIAVDAKGSVIFGDNGCKRLIPGHGAAVVPALFQPGLADQHVHVTDLDCVIGCRRLARTEALLVGGSSGAVIMALAKLKDHIPAGSICVVIFADRGERYLETIFSDAWVSEHFSNVSHFWENYQENILFAGAD